MVSSATVEAGERLGLGLGFGFGLALGYESREWGSVAWGSARVVVLHLAYVRHLELVTKSGASSRLD